MLNDKDNSDQDRESPNAPALQASTDSDADRNSDGSAMTTEQIGRVRTAESIFADILKDAEDDLYDRDGGTNDSELAGQRLQAMAGRLSGAFSQVASGLSLVIETARQKIENAEKNEALIDVQDQREKKKQEEAEKSKDGFTDALDETEKQRKRDAAATLSESQLDAMEWKGDADETWSFNGKEGSRKSWYEAAREMRRKLDKLASENNWTDSERTQQEKALSDFMKAQKNDDQPAAQQAWGKMKPETQTAVNLEREQGIQVQRGMSNEAVESANSLTATATPSTSARAELFEAALSTETKSAMVTAQGAAKEAALLNPPDIKLTEEFSLAAADEPSAPASVRQPQLAAIATTPKAAAPVLTQEFSV